MSLALRLSPAVSHLRARAPWAIGAGVVGLVASAFGSSPPARTVEGVAAMLGTAVGGEVRAEDFVWEERGGFLSDAFVGRRVLFLAKTGPGGRDLYRARVRLTRAGRPVSVDGARDLTESPVGDDGELVAQGHRVGFSTVAFGAVQGITLLDLAGAREAPKTFGEKVRAACDRWIRTGTARGVARTEVVFEKPPTEAKIELEGDLLVMALGHEGLPAALDPKSDVLDTGDKNPYGARAHAIPSAPPSWKALAVLHAGDSFGPGAARRVESALTSIGDAFRSRAAALPPASGAPVASADGFPSEGLGWHAPGAPDGLLPASIPGAPPYFAEASMEADGAAVRMVALDTRRLDFGLAAGAEAPRTATGVHGTGRVPKAVQGRLVAIFATGPADDALAADRAAPMLGVVVDRTPLVPAIYGAPSIAFGLDGAVRVGPWPADGAAAPPWLASLRQTPATFVGAGAGTTQLPRDRRAIARSALCVLPSGQLAYAYARAADTATLGRALAAARCSSALPLAASPADVGFAYARRQEGALETATEGWLAAPLVPGMSLGADALGRGLRGDFAYALLRDAKPSAVLPSGAWEPDVGKQPAPAFLPAVFAATVTELGAQVHVTAFLPGRFAFRIRAGHRELTNKLGGAWQKELDAGEQARALAAIGLGNGRKKTPRGLATDGAAGLHFRPDSGVLVVDGGLVKVEKSDGFAPPPHADATELPLTAEAGKLRPEAREVGTMRPRAAACALDDGTFLVALTTFDTDEANTQALLDIGCRRIVALDRGSHHNAFVARKDTESQPERRYDASALYVVEVPALGRAAGMP